MPKAVETEVEVLTDIDNWDDVPEIEAGIGETFTFDTIGDTVIGEYLGTGELDLDTDDGEETALYHRVKTEDMGTLALSSSFDLGRKLEGIANGTRVRIEYVKNIDTARGQTPMKSFRVQAKLG